MAQSLAARVGWEAARARPGIRNNRPSSAIQNLDCQTVHFRQADVHVPGCRGKRNAPVHGILDQGAERFRRREERSVPRWQDRYPGARRERARGNHYRWPSVLSKPRKRLPDHNVANFGPTRLAARTLDIQIHDVFAGFLILMNRMLIC
jgi:hypothetical protein